MKIWAISDTHGMHWQAIVPDGVDCMIFAGDATNHFHLNSNAVEFLDFLTWIKSLRIKHKVIIAGNHDAWATKQMYVDEMKAAGVTYLNHENVIIEGVQIFGSPYTPSFGNWFFMRNRNEMAEYWKDIKVDTDILVTHGPPKGILDLAIGYQDRIESCGDEFLWKAVYNVRPKYHIFGHIHDNMGNKNFGKFERDIGVTFMNVSSVKDRQFQNGLIHNGIVFEI